MRRAENVPASNAAAVQANGQMNGGTQGILQRPVKASRALARRCKTFRRRRPPSAARTSATFESTLTATPSAQLKRSAPRLTPWATPSPSVPSSSTTQRSSALGEKTKDEAQGWGNKIQDCDTLDEVNKLNDNFDAWRAKRAKQLVTEAKDKVDHYRKIELQWLQKFTSSANIIKDPIDPNKADQAARLVLAPGFESKATVETRVKYIWTRSALAKSKKVSALRDVTQVLERGEQRVVVVMTGRPGSGRRSTASALLGEHGGSTIEVRCARLPHRPDGVLDALTRISREARLLNATPHLQGLETILTAAETEEAAPRAEARREAARQSLSRWCLLQAHLSPHHRQSAPGQQRPAPTSTAPSSRPGDGRDAPS